MEIKLSESRMTRKLESTWHSMERIGRVLEWDEIESFIEWSLDNGVTLEKKLYRKDLTKIYGPDNCIWAISANAAITGEDGLHDFSPDRWDMICGHLRAVLMR